MIMYGSGSMASHSVMALRMEGELYIVESVGPTAGVRRTLYKDWISHHRSGITTFMPLSPESRAKFNVTGAIEFFNKT